ncbi:serine/threonine protein kinase [Mycoplasma sp. ES3157-GEN-MYC]|uniref:Serine/threonine protein kinase n=1 Tax=Mycoplasma miroungigenitalium TaxID=754515 RepID=A0A6M4J9N9_9MOLU|nr:serine/threonine-protein kinase [Mycoplasma miroungigenitalium]MBU4690535.1 serine/threonine protein kinase [Mycoplasma miroungigenitalium]MBU4691802.1 serine/threonine protein kinase [Mycoplasma miroungigenitalium]QJR43663.1 serine/threonine protein kinase [Mycoplasma miroungigenitalium]
MTPGKDSHVYTKYKILAAIGSGGFSDVFKVESLEKPGEIYALKYFVIKKDSDVDTTTKRFKQEIALYKSINSSRIAKYIDSYADDNEQYLVMEYIDGDSLKTNISKGGKLISKTAVNYAMQIAEGIGEIHSCNIIHRDIKSNNVMITRDRNVKIIDFGLALGEDSQRFTQDSKVIGSVYYMAPELCMSDNKPTIQSDIYALGILLYEMLTGSYPFRGADASETLRKQKHSQIPDITKIVDVPQSLANIIIKATAKDPNKRYATMWSMREDLKTSIHPDRFYEKPLDVKKISPKRTAQDIINSKTFLITSISVITLLIIVGIILLVVLI